MPLVLPKKSFFLNAQRKVIKSLYKQGRFADAKQAYTSYKNEGGKLSYNRIIKSVK